MTYQNLTVDMAARIARITINRPDKLNALNRATIDELALAFAAAKADAAVRVIVLRGAGPKAFVAGADISELATLTPTEARETSLKGSQMMLAMERLGKPIIASIQGFALGGGLELAMACTLRIGSENAKLGLPEVSLGLMPGFAGTQRAVKLIGKAAALELMLTGAPIDAARAQALGLLNQVVAAEALDATVDALAEKLAASAPLAMRGILDAVHGFADGPIDAGIDFESTAFGLLFATADMREGTSAFLIKRRPSFSGQ
jgi:enoyl-CoA hydratase